MKRKNLIIIVLFTLLCLFLYCAPLLIATCNAAEALPEQQNIIKVQTKQWQQLKDNTNRLQANLTLLEENLTAQQQRSVELMNLLTEARESLEETQTALQSANASLATAEKSLQTANEYTVKLRRQIKAERDAAAKERERAYWKGFLNGFCWGLAGSAIALVTK